jgi:hypothetical protein
MVDETTSDLGELTPGTTQWHLIKLPGAALANDELRPVISAAGANPGSVLFVNAGVHVGLSSWIPGFLIHLCKSACAAVALREGAC